MAKIIAGVGSSHVPAIGAAIDNGRTQEPYWQRVFAGFERAKEWMSRALVVEPDNLLMRYNFACALANHLRETDVALEMVKPVLERAGGGLVNHAKIDPDLDPIRDDPRFKAMMEAAEKRLTAESQTRSVPGRGRRNTSARRAISCSRRSETINF